LISPDGKIDASVMSPLYELANELASELAN